jgi:hypothetical protein
MADVFNSTVLTATRSNAARADSSAPPAGQLNLKAMTSVAALSGTTGTSVALIHGDVWDQFEGIDSKNVLKDQKLTVTGNRTEVILQNHQHTIVGTTNAKHIGVHNQTNIAPRNDTFVHTRSEDHHQPEQIHQPTSLINIQKAVSEYFNKHTKFSLWFFTMVGIKMDLIPIVNLAYASMEGKLGIIATKALVLEKQAKALDAKYQAAVTHFTLTAVLASALWAKIIMFDGNAGVAANADSPFA